MVINIGAYSTSQVMELTGLSTDNKPTGTYKGTKIAQGSSFLELDTQKVYFYDEENQAWLG